MYFSVVDVVVSDSLRNCNQFAKIIGPCWSTHRSASVAVENKKTYLFAFNWAYPKKKKQRLSVLLLKKKNCDITSLHAAEWHHFCSDPRWCDVRVSVVVVCDGRLTNVWRLSNDGEVQKKDFNAHSRAQTTKFEFEWAPDLAMYQTTYT